MTESDRSAETDNPALLAGTPDAARVSDWFRTLTVLAGVLGLLITLITVEMLVRL